MSVAQDLPTEALLISVDFFTENDHLSMELEISWDTGNFGEHVPDVDKRQRNPARNPQPQAFAGIFEAFL